MTNTSNNKVHHLIQLCVAPSSSKLCTNIRWIIYYISTTGYFLYVTCVPWIMSIIISPKLKRSINDFQQHYLRKTWWVKCYHKTYCVAVLFHPNYLSSDFWLISCTIMYFFAYLKYPFDQFEYIPIVVRQDVVLHRYINVCA